MKVLNFGKSKAKILIQNEQSNNLMDELTSAYLHGKYFEHARELNTYVIERCYVLVRKNGMKNINSYHLSDFYLSLEEVYNIISPILRIDGGLINHLNDLLQVICVKLIVGKVENITVINSSQELKTYSIKEVESLLIPF